MQNTKTNSSVSKLEAEYVEEKRKLYRNVLLCLQIMFAVGCISKMLLYFSHSNLTNLSKIPLYAIITIVLKRYYKKFANHEELVGVALCGIVYSYSLTMEQHIYRDYLSDPVKSFYFGYLCAAGERLITETIPTLKYRLIYIIMTSLIRLTLLTPPDKTSFIYQIVVSCLVVYFEKRKIKLSSYLFNSYFNFKEQIIKFKNLVDNDIPEAILILSQDLNQQMFTNDAFKDLIICESECKHLISIKDQLIKFKVQEVSRYNKEAEDSNLDRQANEMSLQTFLELHFANREHSIDSPKLTRNVTLKKTIHNSSSIKEYLFEAKFFTIMWDKEPCVAVVLHDITQQHTILSLQIANSHKDQVLATVSHELKTPLNGILGMLQIMKKRIGDDAEMQKYLSVCKNSSRLLLSLVNSILDLNQIRTHKLKLNMEAVSVEALLNDIVNLFEIQCHQKGLYLNLNISKNTPKNIITDKNRLSQVLINLVGNALKFTSKGGISIGLKGTEEGSVEFSVKDTGVGIKEEDKSKLFQMGGRLDEANFKTNPHGTGLGLTISEMLVKELNQSEKSQEIQLDTVYGIGSIFSFQIKNSLKVETEDIEEFLDCDYDDSTHGENISNLNIKRYSTLSTKTQEVFSNNCIKQESCNIYKAHTELSKHSSGILSSQQSSYLDLTPTPVSADTNTSRNSSSTILLVDDNPFNLMVAQTLISSHGYKCKTALSGQEAIEIMTNAQPSAEQIDLVFMDCQMPIMDGFETTKKLKSLMSEKKILNIPIVALTANDTEEDKMRSYESGMIEHLSKPLKDSQLVQTLNRYVKKGK